MPQLAFNGFIVQCGVVHKCCHSMTPAPIDALEIKGYSTFLHSDFNSFIKALDTLTGDGLIFFCPLALNEISPRLRPGAFIGIVRAAHSRFPQRR